MPETVNKEPCGVLVVNKHKGVTSHDIINKIRRLYGTKRVGHTGTLDPLATGVLVVLVGRAAKASEYVVCHDKKYRAVLRLGLTSDSEDITGNIVAVTDNIPCLKDVKEACKHFVGEIKQIPPMYSAIKVGGRKLVDIARTGQTIERQARNVTISTIDVAETGVKTDFVLDVSCSAGTYIRTLCADIGTYLGCGGLMAGLERLSVGEFEIEQSVTVEKLENMSDEERVARLMPTEQLFASLNEVRLCEFYERLSRNGCEIYQSKINTSFSVGERVKMLTQSGMFYALGEVRKYDGGTAVKAIKLFDV